MNDEAKTYPRYIRLKTMPFLDASEGKQREKARFVDEIRKIIEQISEGTYTGRFPNNVEGRRLKEIGDELFEGFGAYKVHVDNLRKGKRNGKPNGEPNGGISDQIKSEDVKDNNQIISYQGIRNRLTKEGYSESEIDEAIDRMDAEREQGTEIKSEYAYAKRIIQNLKKDGKPAGRGKQQEPYHQRDYTGETEAAINEFIRMNQEAGKEK